MCALSAIGDQWRGDFPDRYPGIPMPSPIQPFQPYSPPSPIVIQTQVSKADFDKLKAEMEELKKLLLAAKLYDEATGQPDCEMDEKVALIKAVAKMVGVNMDEVFK